MYLIGPFVGLIHSFIHSIHSLTHSLHSFIHSFTHCNVGHLMVYLLDIWCQIWVQLLSTECGFIGECFKTLLFSVF